MAETTEPSGEVAILADRLMSGIAESAGEWAAVRARLLLDHVIATVPREGLSDPSVFRKHLVEQAIPFIHCSGGDPEAHYRFVGANHLLVNMLQPLVEGTDDEYVTTEFEELRDGLDDLERIDVSNPSLNARLSSIFDELVELSMTLGVITSTLPAGAQQKV